MKKVKKLLVAAIAALSLSSCSLEDIKNLPAQAGNTISSTFNDLLEKLGLKKKEEKQEVPEKEDEPGEGEGEKPEPKPEPCNHVDADHDHKCDNCGEVISQHADEDHDHKCDECGAVVSECKDEDHDHNCDICGEKLSEHSDENNDFVCDVCGKQLETVSVELDYSAAKTVFVLGEEFSSEGVKVIATSEVGSKKELAFDVEAPDMTTTGEKEVVVKFGEGEEDVKSYSIEVVYWSESDIAIFDKYSLTSEAPLPFIAGKNMKAELDDEESIFTFTISAENFEESYLDYLNLLRVYEESFMAEPDDYHDESYEITLSMYEMSTYDQEDLEEMFPQFVDVALFALVATEVDEDGDVSRASDYDEYFVLGLEEDGSMKLSSRKVEAWYDSIIGGGFYGKTFLDLTGPYDIMQGEEGDEYNAPDYLMDYTAYIVERLFSEVSATKFLTPDLTEDAVGFSMGSLKTMDPLNDKLDAFDLALEFEYLFASPDLFNNFADKLEDAGFAVQGEGYDKQFIIADSLYGYIEYDLYIGSYMDAYPTLVFDIFYVAPEEYTTFMTADVWDLMDKLEISDYEIDTDYYSKNGELDVWFAVEAPEAIEADEELQIEAQSSEELALLDLIEKLKELGYEVTVDAGADTYYGVFPCWSASLSDYATFNIDVYVFEPDEGECEVTFEITRYYSFTIEDVAKLVFGDIVATENESGNLEAMVQEYVGDPTLAEYSALANSLYEQVKDIANIDAEAILTAKDYSYKLFSGVTKDGKLIFTVIVTLGESGYVVELEIEELSLKETLVRKTLDTFSQTGAVRYYNYRFEENGDISTSLKFGPGMSDTIEGYVYNVVLPLTFDYDEEKCDLDYTVSAELTGGEEANGYKFVYSDGEIDYTLIMWEDESYTYVKVFVGERPAESPSTPEDPSGQE